MGHSTEVQSVNVLWKESFQQLSHWHLWARGLMCSQQPWLWSEPRPDIVSVSALWRCGAFKIRCVSWRGNLPPHQPALIQQLSMCRQGYKHPFTAKRPWSWRKIVFTSESAVSMTMMNRITAANSLQTSTILYWWQRQRLGHVEGAAPTACGAQASGRACLGHVCNFLSCHCHICLYPWQPGGFKFTTVKLQCIERVEALTQKHRGKLTVKEKKSLISNPQPLSRVRSLSKNSLPKLPTASQFGMPKMTLANFAKLTLNSLKCFVFRIFLLVIHDWNCFLQHVGDY